MFDVQMTHRNTQELLNIAQCTSYDAYSQYEVWSLHVSVFSLHEDTHDHADVCTAAVGTAVERSHSVRTTHKSERVRMALPFTRCRAYKTVKRLLNSTLWNPLRHCPPLAVASPAMGHWDTCLLDF